MDSPEHFWNTLFKTTATISTPRSGKLHQMTTVTNNKMMSIGSFDWNLPAIQINDETIVVTHSPQLAKHFIQEADHLWDTAELGIAPHIQ